MAKNGIGIEESFKRDARSVVDGFPMKYDFNRKYVPLFDEQVNTIRNDVERERKEGNYIIYLSCPISKRGGGFTKTNVEITEFVARKLQKKWGHKVWVLNPTAYQMHTNAGRERFEKLAQEMEWHFESEYFNKEIFEKEFQPNGADYMRMWTKILTEDENGQFSYGSLIDMYYFIGPSDVESFLKYQTGVSNRTAAAEAYLSKRSLMDMDYRKVFIYGRKNSDDTHRDEEEAAKFRLDFIKFYSLRAGAQFSKGCHDEWNIWVVLNLMRLFKGYTDRNFGIGTQTPGYFDGAQVDLSSSERRIFGGYALDWDKSILIQYGIESDKK